jgi:hypothetical protein
MDNNTKLPVVGDFVRKAGRLVAIETIEPEPPPQDYIFEEIHARCEIRLNGKVIQEIGTYNDYYGLGTSVTTAIKEMKEYAFKEHITDKSEIEIVIIKVVSQERKRPIIDHSTEDSFLNGMILDYVPLRCGSKYNLPDDIETIAWSSKHPDNEE